MNEIATSGQSLPDSIEDLSRFVLVGRERLTAVRAAIRAIDKVGVAAEVYRQKLEEAQELGETVLDAEVRLGKFRASVPRENGKRTDKPRQGDLSRFETPKQQFDAAVGFTRQTMDSIQKISTRPDIVERVKAEKRESGEIVTRQDILNAITAEKRAAVTARREERRQENAAKINTLATPLEAQGLFQTIVIDPPWDWGDEGDVDQFGIAKPDYSTMSIDEIEKLPVGKIADDNCHLYLWVTNRSLPKAFRLMETWGFRYITCLTWVKPSIGIGNYFRGDTEQILFGIKGSQPLKRHDVGTHFCAPRGKGHSAKPDEFYKLVESCSYAPYIDIFGRKGRTGWSVWGENG